ncbi:MAG: M60 family metallopeptidase, partial [Firmicutes bacterium]|nr:M60 family metallopeptidase [Bacillota bacterium]
MYSTVRRILLPFLCCLVAIAIIVAVVGTGYTVYADDAAAKITVSSANDGSGDFPNVNSQFNDAQYKNMFLIPNSKIASTSNNGGGTLANAFDNNNGTYWTSDQANTDGFKNYVIVNFTQTLKFKDLKYGSSFYSRDDGRHFSGYPTTLNIYAANGNDNFKLVGTCVSEPKKDFSEFVVFSLPEGVLCDRIKIEFAAVSVFSEVNSGAAIAVARDFALYESNEGIYATKKGTGNYADASYLSYNAVSADEMKIRANGGGVINNAFDKNAGTYWTSESYNTDLFKNKVTLTMDIPQTISDIVYVCSYYTRDNGRNFCGFPTKLTVTVTGSDDKQTVYTFIGNPGSDWTHGDFAFPEPVTCKKLELEFIELITFSEVANGNPVVQCGEIYLVKSNSEAAEAMIARINEIFTDYAQYEIKSDVTVATVTEMRNEARYLSNYEQSLKPTLDRAEAILTGAMRKDPYREFSTDPDAKNPIEQYGELANYCRNTLQMTSYGTNRQVIGIGGTTGETITIYVEADEGDPLPSVAFTQITGAWQSWIRTYTLHRGKNEIVFPNFKTSSYSVAVAAGGPIHIVNPYTPEQQSSNVKLYFEGGYVYPVFHDGDDESTFKIILKDYYERLKDPNDSSITIDAFEAVTDNAILSCSATLAYNSYIRNGTSPQFNVDKWRRYTKTTLAYGGVEFDPDKPYYDFRNNYIKVNYRTVQPYAGFYAFAASEHVGLPSSDLHSALVQYWTLGWAFYHEMGHQLDNRRMMIGEVTNNMWAIYNLYMIEGNINDRINVTNVSRYLASDFSDKVGNFWQNGNYNCDFWWILEGACPGYWARLQQLYCFEWHTTDLDSAITSSVERLCYYSSLAIGEDASAYFERFGFYFNAGVGAKFTEAGASQAFKDAMAAAKKAGRIKDTDKKYWYVNNGQYRAIRAHDGTLDTSWGSCYSTSQKIQPTEISGTPGNYTLRLPTPQNSDAHLCYEIQSYINGEWKVLGVTDGITFTDTYNYGGATPQYRVYAYDRFFNHTGDAKTVSPQANTQTDVCRIGDVKYNTLKEAVAAAKVNDTIYLLKDFKDGGIRIDKSGIKIIPDPAIFTGDKGVTITKNTSGDLFYIVWDDVVFGTSSNNVPTSAPIILDGGSFSQSGALIRTCGKRIYLNNVTMQNNYNSGNGGGLCVEYGTIINLNGCTIKNNRASDGGGIASYSYSEINLRGLTVTGNVASGKGGGLYMASGFWALSCRDINGVYPDVIINGNSAANGGGVYAERTTELFNAQITNNTATANGGGVYTAVNEA